MPPDQYTLPGNYVADAVAVSVSNPVLYRTSSSTSFELLDYSAPPTADFSYNPLFIYQNMTVTFDAIGSSANGYNDTIIGYEWTIDDPYDPVHITETPPDSTVTHAFSHLGTFTVQVNVTDSEGLWATSMKPVNILPEFDPQANFTHVPITPVINQTATFNASQSQPGWSAQLAAYAPIVSYTWDWNDGTPNNVTSLSSMTHKFTAINNYTVTLTVADSIGRVNSVNALIQVVNRSLYDLNGDGTIDIKDISIVAKAFGTQPGDPLWNPIADINGDSIVDIKDVSTVAKHYGETFP
jgi:PKD repeat protein